MNHAKVFFGTDSAAPGASDQWLVPLTARYVRTTGTLASGSVKALATFTMSSD
ncbi:hypothetical protein [Caballeronia humi]|uniref:hypothetical protein n=1 Tax=Caballeronia humi TaxID=326474 RepID=UPI00135C0ABA|nr:hypothetical protein [Caballeronia humi]